MGIENKDSFVLPSNPQDRENILKLFQELSDSMTRIAGEKEYIKEAINIASENYSIPKKILRKAANTFHKESFEKEAKEAEDFQSFYEQIVNLES